MATKHVHALWINMREEPMVYINGTPFVLREEVWGVQQRKALCTAVGDAGGKGGVLF